MIIKRRRRWDEKNLRLAAASSRSLRQVLQKLGLREAGGNYEQIKKYLKEYKVDISHFKGRLWSKGMKIGWKPLIPLGKILIKHSTYQSYKLKRRLFQEQLKTPKCEQCGWAKAAPDGRVPLELDHVNGDRHDNRIGNLRILCPNCHSLQPTHRGLNRRHAGPVVERYTRDT